MESCRGPAEAGDSEPIRAGRGDTRGARVASILVAEDDADVRHLLTHTLVEAGYEVAAARDGETALQMALASRPDVVVLDLMLPGMDGFQVLAEILACGLTERIKVLVLTARGAEQDWQRAFELGAMRYVTKPFDPNELTDTVAELLRRPVTELAAQREHQRDQARLLSQLESLFDGP